MTVAGLRPRLAAGVRIREDRVRGGHNLLAPEHVLRINASSAAILALCDGQRSLREIVDHLARDYAADRTRIECDVIALIDDLASRGLVDK
ncbi:MAG: pyrroloquinoline quinone biosynthesis peptide chaperone PqqD [Bosea sp. (in: a-proteobacteria)]|nr:pyrroloquinoline quinone biosynthesis peptide chaperone PqqD [Bosea sp. (in: a-proteobacteria)]